MAESPTSQHRTNLIRQMARDLQNSRPISISSRASDSNSNIDNESTSEFNPSADGLGSTRNMEEPSQQLPQPRTKTQAYSQRVSHPEPDYKINTSALGRAFPNFSRSGSERDDDSSRSIELGRGHPGGNNADEHSSRASAGNIRFSQPGPISKKESPASLKRALESHRRSMERGASHASPRTVKATDYVSSGSRQSSLEKENAHGDEEENATHFSEDRPLTVNITSRSSRFGNAATGQGAGMGDLPKNFTSSKDFLKKFPRTRGSRLAATRPNDPTVTSQGTMQSYLIPDMPNISELISGTLEDGTPIFSRHTKARTPSGSTRFASLQGRKSRFGHYAVGEIAVPEEEEAIFVSLRVLQEKIANLESQRSEHEAQIETLKEKNKLLELETTERRRVSSRDSGIGHASGSDADDDFARKSRKAVIERTRLETSIKALQEKLDVATKNVKTSEITIKNLSSERDSAISQLGVAFVNMEQLKVDKETLLGENEALKAELLVLRGQPHVYPTEPTNDRYGKAQNDLERAASRESGPSTRQDYTEVLDIDANPYQNGHSASQQQLGKEAVDSKMPKKRKTRLVLEEYSESETGEEDKPKETSKPHRDVKDGIGRAPAIKAAQLENDTVLSAMGSGLFTDLRQLLERARTVRRHQTEVSQNLQHPSASMNQLPVNDRDPIEPKVPKKSSMKSLKPQTVKKGDATYCSEQNGNLTFQSKVSANAAQARAASPSAQGSRRRSVAKEDMTSAFIMPDVTLRNPGEATVKLSQSAREVFDSLAQHDSNSCSICKRVVEYGVPHEHREAAKLTVSKPIPVSERMPSPEPNNDEPTIRPSQPPSVALATVIKNLEDEVKHLKIEESEYQAQYLSHDPSLSKRKREAVLRKIQRLLSLIETKSNQIYALYDVLEGQKQSGQEMNEEEVEVTLNKIGLDIHELSLRGGDIDEGHDSDASASNSSDGDSAPATSDRPSSKHAAPRRKKTRVKHVWDLDSDDDDELPWEGFETTGELSGRSGYSKRRG